MRPCCLESARRYLQRANQVATCDGCGNLLLAYGDERALEATRQTLVQQNEPFECERLGRLNVVAKARVRRT